MNLQSSLYSTKTETLLRQDLSLVFWMDSPSIHQIPYIRALAERQVEVTLVVRQMSFPHRASWQIPDVGNIRVIESPSPAAQRSLLNMHQQSTHVFAGLHGNHFVDDALHLAIHKVDRIGIISETSKWMGPKGFVRRLHGRYLALKYAKQIDFILAMGSIGVRWFRQTGFPHSKLYPFCYVTSSPKISEVATQTSLKENLPNEPISIIYIGSLIKRKRVDLLLTALADHPDYNWHLNIVGDGDQEKFLHSLAEQLHIENRVTFTKMVPNKEIWDKLIASDVLVLPSSVDGWGAVVNEALSVGTYVVCSSHCGSSDLLHDQWRGLVFDYKRPKELSQLMGQVFAKGKLSTDDRNRIKLWAQQHITDRIIADYFLSVLQHVYREGTRPIVPWH